MSRNPRTRPLFDLYIIKNFLDLKNCRELIADMRSSAASPALTYGKGEAAIDERVRRVKQVSVSRDSIVSVTQRLEQQRTAVERHFSVNLTNLEEPQFLCYQAGDFFVAHQDGNTGLVNLESD